MPYTIEVNFFDEGTRINGTAIDAWLSSFSREVWYFMFFKLINGETFSRSDIKAMFWPRALELEFTREFNTLLAGWVNHIRHAVGQPLKKYTPRSIGKSREDEYNPFPTFNGKFLLSGEVKLQSDLDIFLEASAEFQADKATLEHLSRGSKEYAYRQGTILTNLQVIAKCCIGDFLPGMNSKWVRIHRQEIHKQQVEALRELYTMLHNLRQHDAFLPLYHAFTRMPHRGDVVMLIMNICHDTHDYDMAWRYYKAHRIIMAKKGLALQRELQDLYSEYNLNAVEKKHTTAKK